MGNDDQKVITFDFCFTVQITYLKSYSKKRKIFWVDLHIFGKKFICNQGKLGLLL